MPKDSKLHVMPFCPGDMRSSKVRIRSILTGDYMLRLVYRELLDVLWEKGGTVTDDAEALVDELGLPAAEIERCLRILLQIRGALIEVPGGQIANPRVLADITKARSQREQARHDGRFGATKRWGEGRKPDRSPSRDRRDTIGSDGVPDSPPMGCDSSPSPSPSPTPSPSISRGGPSPEELPDAPARETALEATVTPEGVTQGVRPAPARTTPPLQGTGPSGGSGGKRVHAIDCDMDEDCSCDRPKGPTARLVGRGLERFRKWWALYPPWRRSRKPDAELLWIGLTDREQEEALAAAPGWASTWASAPESRRRWMPGPVRFLERRRWEEPPETWAREATEEAAPERPQVGQNGGAFVPKRDLETAPEPIKDIYRRVQFRGDYTDDEFARLRGWLQGEGA